MSKKEQGLRLYQAVERLCIQAGTDPDETVDWLCGEHGGMAQLFLQFFSPKASGGEPLANPMANQAETAGSPVQRNPLSGYINRAGINANDSPHIVVEKLERAIEAAHGIKE